MKKSFKLTELDCANCAAKMERSINDLPEVNSATVNFMTQKLILDADDMDVALDKAQAEISKVEKNCKIEH